MQSIRPELRSSPKRLTPVHSMPFFSCSCIRRHLDSARRPQVTLTDRSGRDFGGRVDKEDCPGRGLDGVDARILGRDGHLYVSRVASYNAQALSGGDTELIGNVQHARSPNISVYWSVYESLKSRYIPGYSATSSSSSRPSTPAPEHSTPPGTIPLTLRYTLCSVTACVIAATTTTPIEIVQARWQTSGGKIEGGLTEIVKTMWRTGGPMAFTRGLGIRIAYAVRGLECDMIGLWLRFLWARLSLICDCGHVQMPANGISMTVYESVKRWKGIS